MGAWVRAWKCLCVTGGMRDRVGSFFWLAAGGLYMREWERGERERVEGKDRVSFKVCKGRGEASLVKRCSKKGKHEGETRGLMPLLKRFVWLIHGCFRYSCIHLGNPVI